MMNNVANIEVMIQSIKAFVSWLNAYGETSYDFQTCYAGELGKRAKALYYQHQRLGILAVSPMVICEALIPEARRFFWVKQRFPIADAHYAMAFTLLYEATQEERYLTRAEHFLSVLLDTRCPGFEHHAWGYPFDWVTVQGTIKAGTPLITTVPYVYEAFRDFYRIDRRIKWLDVMRSIAEHAYADYGEVAMGADAATSSYTPCKQDRANVVNASAYRGYLLTVAAADFSEPRYRERGLRYLRYVMNSQNEDGSWFYATDGVRQFIDHFHTCFVLKALAKVESLQADKQLTSAIERGIQYYVRNLFDKAGLPKPFARKPRLTVYRRELYDFAECINLTLLLKGRFSELDALLPGVLRMSEWQKEDGSFRTRKLLLGWDEVPMHRWAQSQMFRSLCLFARQQVTPQPPVANLQAKV